MKPTPHEVSVLAPRMDVRIRMECNCKLRWLPVSGVVYTRTTELLSGLRPLVTAAVCVCVCATARVTVSPPTLPPPHSRDPKPSPIISCARLARGNQILRLSVVLLHHDVRAVCTGSEPLWGLRDSVHAHNVAARPLATKLARVSICQRIAQHPAVHSSTAAMCNSWPSLWCRRTRQPRLPMHLTSTARAGISCTHPLRLYTCYWRWSG